jgi:hypothetical protein
MVNTPATPNAINVNMEMETISPMIPALNISRLLVI